MKKLGILILMLTLTILLSAQYQLRTTSANLNLRTSPFIRDNVICVIPKDAVLSVNYSNQEFNEWIKITYNGKTGYAFSKYLRNPDLKDYYSNPQSSVKYYTNSFGEKVQSPTYYASPPAGATAECRDGTYSFSRNRRGTCSHHGGVKRWL